MGCKTIGKVPTHAVPDCTDLTIHTRHLPQNRGNMCEIRDAQAKVELLIVFHALCYIFFAISQLHPWLDSPKQIRREHNKAFPCIKICDIADMVIYTEDFL